MNSRHTGVELPVVALPQELVFSSVELPSKPGCEIRYAHVLSSIPSETPQPLVVFLNGLLLPQVGWHPSISRFIQKCKAQGCGWPAMLTYDRFGQGQTIASDPLDKGKEPYGHDSMASVRDLHELVQTLEPILSPNRQSTEPRSLVFVANSIGCAFARLYAQKYPGTVSGLVFLDSIMANSDFVDSIWPDPDSSDFVSDRDLPDDVTVEDLREVREKYKKIFHPSVPNSENLDRRNLASLLPRSDSPRLLGKHGKDAPKVIVVGHDPDKFASDSLRDFGTPTSLTNRYANRIWHQYNVGLTAITDSTRSKGPLKAARCGHFIQRDDPELVSQLLGTILKELGS